MAMLPPKYNHLGRSNQKLRNPPQTKELLAAKAEHDRFLRSMGIDLKRRPRLKGAVESPLTANPRAKG